MKGTLGRRSKMAITAFEELEQEFKKPELTMAPLIDMVFLLLIFFVVTTTFTKETGIQVDKARAATSQALPKNLMVISLDKSGQYWYDGKVRPLDETVATAVSLSKQNEDLNIVIVPDRSGQIEPLITIMDRLRAHGLTRFSLGTRRAEEQ